MKLLCWAADLVQRLVAEHFARNNSLAVQTTEVRLPLIPADETGPIPPITGADIDNLFARDDFAS
jgi:hypothetical protein